MLVWLIVPLTVCICLNCSFFLHISLIGTRIWAFDWSQNLWPWMTLNGVMALILRYFTEFGSFRVAMRRSGWRCSSRWLSHLLMNFLFVYILFIYFVVIRRWFTRLYSCGTSRRRSSNNWNSCVMNTPLARWRWSLSTRRYYFVLTLIMFTYVHSDAVISAGPSYPIGKVGTWIRLCMVKELTATTTSTTTSV